MEVFSREGNKTRELGNGKRTGEEEFSRRGPEDLVRTDKVF